MQVVSFLKSPHVMLLLSFVSVFSFARQDLSPNCTSVKRNQAIEIPLEILTQYSKQFFHSNKKYHKLSIQLLWQINLLLALH